MKKILLSAALIAATMAAQSQAHLQVGFGMACYNSSIGSEIEVGYSYKRFVLAASIDAPLNNLDPMVAAVKFGHRFCLESVGLQITGGYAFHYKSADTKELNKNSWIVSAQVVRALPKFENTAWYIGATASGQYLFVTFGGRYTFKSKK